MRTDTVDDIAIEGNEQFSLTATLTSQGSAYLSSATATILDNDIAPTTDNVAVSGPEDAPSIAVTLTGGDVDGTVASFSLADLPENGTLYSDAGLTTLVATGSDYPASGNSLTLFFVPDGNWNGTTGFNYAAKDNSGIVDATPATATINVTPVNDAPLATDNSNSIVEDATLPASGNLLLDDDGAGVDSDPDGTDVLSVVQINGVTNAALDVSGAYGALNWGSDGSYQYLLDNGNATVQALAAGESLIDTFTYTLSDGQGGSDTATLTITINGITDGPPRIIIPDNDPAGAGDEIVAEAGLLDVADTSELVSSSFTVSAEAGLQSVSIAGQSFSSAELAATSTTPVTIATPLGQLEINGFDSGTGTLSYTYTLGSVQDHSGGEIIEQLAVVVTDLANVSSSDNLDIRVIDDEPVGRDISESLLVSPEALTYNILVVLDRSGSMAWDANGNQPGDAGFDPSTVRIDIARQALGAMFDQYDALGNVNIRIVDFSTDVNQTGWFVDNKYSAMDYVNDLSPNGGTRYNTALNGVMDGYITPPAADKTVFYFISDGEPNAGYEVGSALESEWETFVTNSADIAFGIGIGDVGLDSLQPIAYPDNADGSSDFAIMVDSVADLEMTLVNTVEGSTISGTVTSGSLMSDRGFIFGADGGYVDSITVDGTTYSYDPATSPSSLLTLTTALGASLEFDFATGQYTYSIAYDSSLLGQQEVFAVTAVDGDGDAASLNLIANLSYDVGLDANRDIVLTNITDGDPIEISADALLHNDNLGAGAQLTAAGNAVGGSLSGTDPVVFDPTGSLNGSAGFGAVASIITEPGADGEGTPLNNSMATAVDLSDRSLFGLPDAGMRSYTTYDDLPAAAYYGTLDNDGNSGNGQDQDWLKVKLFGSERLFFDVDDAGNVNVDLFVYDDQGNLLHSDTQDDPYSWFTAPEEGEYFVRLQSHSPTDDGDYKLFMSIDSSAADLPSASFDYTIESGTLQDTAAVNFSAVDGNLLSGGANDEILISGAGSDTLSGGGGKDVLLGNAGNDSLSGGSGNDLLVGGAGNDILNGDEGRDIFSWQAGDQGDSTTPASDQVILFETGSNGDTLDLSELLQNEESNPLTDYLQFDRGDFDADGNADDTKISVDHDGGPSFQATQEIILNDVDLTAGGTLSQQDIINDLINNKNLETD